MKELRTIKSITQEERENMFKVDFENIRLAIAKGSELLRCLDFLEIDAKEIFQALETRETKKLTEFINTRYELLMRSYRYNWYSSTDMDEIVKKDIVQLHAINDIIYNIVQAFNDYNDERKHISYLFNIIYSLNKIGITKLEWYIV